MMMQALGLSFGIATVALAVRLGPPGVAGGSINAVALAAAFLGL